MNEFECPRCGHCCQQHKWVEKPDLARVGEVGVWGHQREWVGLTAKDVVDAYISVSDKEWAIGGLENALPFVRAIEDKLKEKNRG